MRNFSKIIIHFDYIVVNSDSDEILNSAKLANNKTILIKRPDDLSGDIIMPDSAVTHSLQYLTEHFEDISEDLVNNEE